jgi:hypothetical protein
VINTGTDGYQTADGKIITYTITGTSEIDSSSKNVTNTFEELKEDVKIINKDIKEFNDDVWSGTPFTYGVQPISYSGILVFRPEYKLNIEEVFTPFSKNFEFTQNVFRRVYMIISNDVTDAKKYESFKNVMIGNIINNPSLLGDVNIGKLFDDYWIGVKPIFEEENNITKEFINKMEEKLKKFLKYTPFSLKKKRTFEYSTSNVNTDGQQKLIKGLGWVENQNTNNKTWNDESPINVFISKAKLN